MLYPFGRSTWLPPLNLTIVDFCLQNGLVAELSVPTHTISSARPSLTALAARPAKDCAIMSQDARGAGRSFCRRTNPFGIAWTGHQRFSSAAAGNGIGEKIRAKQMNRTIFRMAILSSSPGISVQAFWL
jgi:hypothetical protein